MFSYSLTWLVGAGWRGHASSPSPRRSALRTPCRLRPLRRPGSGKRRREATCCRPSASSSWVAGARDLGVFSTSGSSKSGDCCTGKDKTITFRRTRFLVLFLVNQKLKICIGITILQQNAKVVALAYKEHVGGS